MTGKLQLTGRIFFLSWPIIVTWISIRFGTLRSLSWATIWSSVMTISNLQLKYPPCLPVGYGTGLTKWIVRIPAIQAVKKSGKTAHIWAAIR